MAQVESRVQTLVDPVVLEREATARLEPLDDRLRVEVRSGGGALLVVKDLVTGPSCEDLAAAAAVVIATALRSAPGSGELPSYGPIAIPMPVLPSRPPVKQALLAVELGLSVGIEAQLPRPGGGGFVWASLAPARGSGLASRFGLLVRLGGTSLKQQTLSQGTVDWTRLDVSLGPRLRLGAGTWLCDLLVAVTPAWVLVQGRDLPVTFDSQGFDLGLGGGARAGARLGSLLPFGAVQATGFLRAQRLRVLGSEEQLQLPAYAVQLSLGLGWLALP